MTALRLIRDVGFGARGNVAMTAAMVELHDAGKTPDTLRLYRYPRSVLLGRNQSAAEAADLALCHDMSIEIARRITGGGAIYMDAGVVTFDLLLAPGNGLHAAALSARVCGSIANELGQLRVAAQFRPDNDIVAGGRKLFGASGFASGATLLYQGSLMVSPDLASMSEVLRIADLADRVATVSDLAARPVTIEQMEDVLARAIGKTLGRPLEAGALSRDEIELQKKLLVSEFGQAAFVFPERAAA